MICGCRAGVEIPPPPFFFGCQFPPKFKSNPTSSPSAVTAANHTSPPQPQKKTFNWPLGHFIRCQPASLQPARSDIVQAKLSTAATHLSSATGPTDYAPAPETPQTSPSRHCPSAHGTAF